MKKYLAAMALAFSCVAHITHAETGVPPEVPTMVDFSNKEINRIVCPGEISDLIFSKEKGLTGHFTGNSAYIKFSIEEMNGKRTYASEPSELYVICDGSTYSIVANPIGKQPATVRLAPPKSADVDKNIAIFKNMPLENQIIRLIKDGYAGSYPSSYKLSETSPAKISLPDLDMKEKERVDIDGVGLRLKIFQVVALADKEIEEKTFLTNQISDSIIAISIEDHKVRRGHKTRILVVERKEKDGPSAMSEMIRTTVAGGSE
jgi:conjugal transfer pilus assembly protein TraK